MATEPTMTVRHEHVDEVEGNVGHPIKSLPPRMYQHGYESTPLPDRTSSVREALQQLRDAKHEVANQMAILKEDRMDAENNLKMLEEELNSTS